MAFGTPTDDDQPQYNPLTALLAGYAQPGMAGLGQQQAAPVAAPTPTAAPAQSQTPIPYLPQDQQPAGNQTAAAQQPAQPTQATPQMPTVALPPAPAAPAIDEAKYQALQAQVDKYAKPTDRNDPSVKSKWYDRVLGGLVGFGAGYHGDVAGGIRAGSAITNKRYDEAEADREGNEKGAQQSLGNYEHQIELADKQYSTGLEGQRVSQSAAEINKRGADSDRDYAQRVEDTAFNQARETKNDAVSQSNNDREFAQRGQFHADELTEQQSRDAESSRHNKASEGLEGARVGMEGQRLKIDKDKADREASDNSPSATLLKARAGVDAAADEAMNKLEFGDPKGASEDERNGFKATRAALAKSSKDPVTNQPWKPGERDAAVQAMDEQQAQRKNGIAAAHSQQLGRLGINEPAIQYDAAGNVLNAPQRQAQQTPSQQQQQQAPPPRQQQQQPPAQQQQQAPPQQQRQVSVQKAMTLPQYKGKSAQEVQQEIEKHGYKAIP